MQKVCKCGVYISAGHKKCIGCIWRTDQLYCIVVNCFNNRWGSDCFCQHHFDKFQLKRDEKSVDLFIQELGSHE